MKIPNTALSTAFSAIALAVAGLFFQGWILGIILSWFNVSLTIWQNVLIILLVHMITTNTNK